MDQDNRNILDCYKGIPTQDIKAMLQKKALPFSVLMQQLEHDFNIGTIVRNANAFGAESVYYYGPSKRWDRRSGLGTQNYIDVKYLRTIDEIVKLKEKYEFVALENNIDRNSIEIKKFPWTKEKRTLLIFGEEQKGLCEELLDLCDYIVHIEILGSVRSLNAGCASAIAMFDYVQKYSK